MGSLSSSSSPLHPTLPSSQTEDPNPPTCQVYVVFCRRGKCVISNISNWIECYDPSNNTWRHVTSIPNITENHILKDFSMVSLGDSIYIIGGRLCRREINPTCDKSDDEFLEFDVEVSSSVLRYNVQSDIWSTCTSLTTPRYDFACAVSENKIYVAGGKSNLANGARGIPQAEGFDPALDKWTPLPNMSTLRYKCVGLTWQGKFHVVGGFVERVDSNRTVSFTDRCSAELYDTQAEKWDLVAGMWQLDVPPNQIVEVDNRLFSSGDCLKPWKGHIDVYDMNLNMWTEVNGSHLQTLDSQIRTSSNYLDDNWSLIERLYLTVAAIGTQLYFISGYRMAGESPCMLSKVHVFDTRATSNAWRSFEPIIEEGEKELCSHCCVVQLD